MKRKEERTLFSHIFTNTTLESLTPNNLLNHTIPDEIFNKISSGNALTKEDINNWAMTCNRFHTIFRGLDYWSYQLRICVAHGKQDRVEMLLKINLNFMINKGEVTDYSGRLFPCISGFQYALGALDTRYMVGMMLDCIKENNRLTVQEKKEIVIGLRNQYLEVEEEGVFYILDGKEHREKHFGFSPLLEALQEYNDKMDQWSLDERRKYFSTQVGKAQYYVPAHVAQHYCHPSVALYPIPDFKSKVFIRSLNVSTYICLDDCNSTTNNPQEWWGVSDFSLGIDCGILRRSYWWAAWFTSAPTVSQDLAAMADLFKIRTEDYRIIPQSLMDLMKIFDSTKEELDECSAVCLKK